MSRRWTLPAALFTALLCAFSSLPTAAAGEPGAAAKIKLSLEADAVDGMCELGDTVLFTAELECRGKVGKSATLQWSVETVAFEAPVIEQVELELAAGETASFVYSLEMKTHGFVQVSCTISEQGAKRDVTRSRRIGCEPTKVLSPLTAESDLEDFWAGSLKELAAVAPEYQLIKQEVEEGADHELYEVVMRSFGGARVRGWLQLPLTDGPHPALLRVPGYTQNMRPLDSANEAVVFSFNIRGHGRSTDDVPGQPVDYWVRGLDDRDTYYYRGAYLDCVRAVDFLCSRGDVDTDQIAIWGASQGGGLAFATAALDERIDLCVSDIPWLCDWKNYLELAGKNDEEEIKAWLQAKPERTPESTLKTLSYFDTMNLAHRIKCPTLMGVGLQDSICPPSTSFATYNRITAPRDYRIYEDSGHGLGWDHIEWVISEMKERFGG